MSQVWKGARTATDIPPYALQIAHHMHFNYLCSPHIQAEAYTLNNALVIME